jgi:hypothetical protein
VPPIEGDENVMSDPVQKRRIQIGRTTLEFPLAAKEIDAKLGHVRFRAYMTFDGEWRAIFSASTLWASGESTSGDLQKATSRALGCFRRDVARVRRSAASEPNRLWKERSVAAARAKRHDARLGRKIDRAYEAIPQTQKRAARALEAVR